MRPSTKAKLGALKARLRRIELDTEPAMSEGARELELLKLGVVDEAPLERLDPLQEPSHPEARR
jgi:hypothetical protein